jgi:hypothetical protein
LVLDLFFWFVVVNGNSDKSVDNQSRHRIGFSIHQTKAHPLRAEIEIPPLFRSFEAG